MSNEAGGGKEKMLLKAERKICWDARDGFWECMKSNSENVDKCLQARKAFEASCPPSWVAHFDRKFQYDKFKSRLETEGYQKLDEEFESKQGSKKGQS